MALDMVRGLQHRSKTNGVPEKMSGTVKNGVDTAEQYLVPESVRRPYPGHSSPFYEAQIVNTYSVIDTYTYVERQ